MESRYTKKDTHKQVGRWTSEEHQKFVQGLMLHGKNWKKVQQVVGTRTASQVRSHAQKFFNRINREQRRPSSNSQSESKFVTEEHATNNNQDTPEKLISLIRKESKEDRSVNVNNFINTLKNQSHDITQSILKKKSSEIEPGHQGLHEIAELEKERHQINSMTNLVSAFNNISEEHEKDESFFLGLIKKYKRFLTSNSFIELIDVPHHNETILSEQEQACMKKERKRSFHLIEDSKENQQHYNALRKLLKTENEEMKPEPTLPEGTTTQGKTTTEEKFEITISPPGLQN